MHLCSLPSVLKRFSLLCFWTSAKGWWSIRQPLGHSAQTCSTLKWHTGPGPALPSAHYNSERWFDLACYIFIWLTRYLNALRQDLPFPVGLALFVLMSTIVQCQSNINNRFTWSKGLAQSCCGEEPAKGTSSNDFNLTVCGINLCTIYSTQILLIWQLLFLRSLQNLLCRKAVYLKKLWAPSWKECTANICKIKFSNL